VSPVPFTAALLAIQDAAKALPACPDANGLPVSPCGYCAPCRARRFLWDAKAMVIDARSALGGEG
jgi:hypothetical protein